MFRPLMLSAAAMAAIASLAPSAAFAGYTATTGVNTVLTPDGPQPGPQIGDTFTVNGGTFTSFIGDTLADPTIIGNDLNFDRYNLSGAVSDVSNVALGIVGYTGTYTIFYDQNLNGVFDDGLRISSGTFSYSATFIPATNNAAISGSLIQTQGPNNANFRDLSYGGNPVLVNGTYLGTDPGVSGTLALVLRQNAVVPEPTSLALLGLGGLALRRRR